MARFVKGDIVIVPFPFSGKDGFKKRPALVLASWDYGNSSDYLVTIITSQTPMEPLAIGFDSNTDVENGVLINRTPSGNSYIRPTYLYSVGEGRILARVCTLKAELLNKTLKALCSLLSP